MADERPLPRFQPRRQLGRTGFSATVVGIGDLADRSVPLERCVATLHRAMDAGLNVLDTAPGYEDGLEEILPLAKARGVGTVSFKTFGAGKLLGDTEGYGRPLQARPRGKVSSGGADTEAPSLPHLGVEECVHYTLTLDPDVALLGMSFSNEQDAALAAAASFRPLTPEQLADVRQRAMRAMEGKGAVWWNP